MTAPRDQGTPSPPNVTPRLASKRTSACRRNSRCPDGGAAAAGEAISIGVRLRPFPPGTSSRQDGACVQVERSGRVLLLDPVRHTGRSFQCDFALDSSDPTGPGHAGQQAVYEAVGQQLLERALQGFNCSIIAYGQTGTGKTHTMVGDWTSSEHKGLIPRVTEALFTRLEAMKGEGTEVQVQASCIEVYNNQLYDLLADAVVRRRRMPTGGGAPSPSGAVDAPPFSVPAAGGGVATGPAAGGAACGAGNGGRESVRERDARLEIFTHPKMGVYVDNLTEEVVTHPQEVRRLFFAGDKLRHTASTSMNDKSSRSHVIFSFGLEIKGSLQEGHRMATLQFVDLAGRESEQTSECKGERFRELTFINRSLFQLANCVSALSSGSRDHIPFRNSKLTMLLSESLSRNSRTCFLATLTPAAVSYEENLLTCRFLESTGRITTQPMANHFSAKDLCDDLRVEIDQVRRQLGIGALSSILSDAEQEDNAAKLRCSQALLKRIAKDSLLATLDALESREPSQASIAKRWEQAARIIVSAEGSLHRLDKANELAGASINEAEHQLQTVQKSVSRLLRWGSPLDQQPSHPGVPKMSHIAKLPPILGVSSPRAERQQQQQQQQSAHGRNEPTSAPIISTNIVLPPIVVL